MSFAQGVAIHCKPSHRYADAGDEQCIVDSCGTPNHQKTTNGGKSILRTSRAWVSAYGCAAVRAVTASRLTHVSFPNSILWI